eukprot:7035172-Heterocapsa_arctica.AAC.1
MAEEVDDDVAAGLADEFGVGTRVQDQSFTSLALTSLVSLALLCPQSGAEPQRAAWSMRSHSSEPQGCH